MKSRIIPLMRKEAIHIRRDPRSLYSAIGLPLLLLILFGYALTLEIRHLAVGIINLDNSSLSRDLIGRVTASGYFKLEELSKNAAESEKLLDEGRVKIILIIPRDFSRDLDKGKNAAVQLLVDGCDSNTALIGLGYLSGIIQSFSTNILIGKLESQGGSAAAGIPGIDPRFRIWYNPGLISTDFTVPGIIAVVMMVMTTMLTSLTVAREWETGTMEQLMSAPTRPHEIIIGKLLPYFLLGLIQMSLVILLGRILFKVPLKGSILFLFGISSLFLVCGLGIGLFLSVTTKSQQLAFSFSFLATLLPSFLLSGFVFPISSMPKIIQYVTYIVPARYFLTIIRGIFLKGNGLAVLWPEVLPLVVFALLIILACAKKMKMSLE
jgi:ABC-2 type transport system permease protein